MGLRKTSAAARINGSATLRRYLTATYRWLTGRCQQCGERNWMARSDGYTIPTPVCGACGHVPFVCDGD